MHSRPRTFALVSTRDSMDYTAPAVESFLRTTPLRAEDRLIVIDNDRSLDPSLLLSHERLSILSNEAPRGFAGNVNQMIECATIRGADLFFLNNDIVFTSNWLDPLLIDEPWILTPLSNREVQYVSSVVVLKTHHVMSMFQCGVQPVTLDYFKGNEAQLEAIVEAHRRAVHGYLKMMVLPFFCVKLPLPVLETVGRFEERYGSGGGEDYDYCLRAYLAGFEVRFALGSYLLHFGGKSTWDGVSERHNQEERRARFHHLFRERWGDALADLILEENAKVLETLTDDTNPSDIKARILQLLGDRQVTIKQ